jgi:hypothetical protein
VLIPCHNLVYSSYFIQQQINLIANWFISNLLKLNVKKTQAIYFTLNDRCIMPFFYINCNPITTVDSVKYLGCHIDSHLKWNVHIMHVCRCVSKGIAMLKVVHKLFPLHIKLQIYYAFVYSYIIYCITVWGNASNIYTNNLFVLQKCSLRLLINETKFAHTKPIAHKLGLLLLNDIYIARCANIMYEILHNSGLNNLTIKLMYVSSKSVHALRDCCNLIVYFSRTALRYNTFPYPWYME